MWREQLKAAIKGRVLFDEPLTRYTSFGIGGPADIMVFPRDLEDLKAALALAREHKVPFFFIGGGTNLLVMDKGIRGMVVNLSRSLNGIAVNGETVRAGGGARVSRLPNYCCKKGLAGLEFLAGMPGTVGGAVKGNAGAWGNSIGDVLSWVRVLGAEGGERVYIREALDFSYRSSSLPAGDVVVEAAFSLKADDPAIIRARIRRFLNTREEKQPMIVRSAGSIFKNPPGDYAGRLIEAVGLKGLRQGNAQISPKHANFIVNLGGATATDVLSLIDLARERVREEAGIELEMEIQVVGEE